MKTGIELISEERDRQIKKEGWTEFHDAQYKRDELARAAAAYAMPDRFRDKLINGKPRIFPFMVSWWKPADKKKKRKGHIHELVQSGALISAEIDRLQKDLDQ